MSFHFRYLYRNHTGEDPAFLEWGSYVYMYGGVVRFADCISIFLNSP